ncbi:hypothetical protein DPMN_157158 [Dreissena polymorpha]|uniref:Uncharacterized protein n=1 Tax=Dreissena polymorpha TaxID=45954 RepID=A0A9D4EGK9_DREPO|nr:hypothetical protein DPMN_157158 [Dreissena polymorpha]
MFAFHSLSGLKTDVDVLTCPGKKLHEIQSNLSREIATKYNNIVVYAGGNDAASGSARSTLYNDVKSLILDIGIVRSILVYRLSTHRH